MPYWVRATVREKNGTLLRYEEKGPCLTWNKAKLEESLLQQKVASSGQTATSYVVERWGGDE